MKGLAVIGMLAIFVLSLVTGCDDSLSTTEVSFKNNSASRSVYAVWDGINMGTLAPGQKSESREVNPGNHTIQWMDASNNKALTSIGWPNITAGSHSTFPYND